MSKLWVVSKNDETNTQYLQKKDKAEFTDCCSEGNLCWSGSHSEQSRLLSYVGFLEVWNWGWWLFKGIHIIWWRVFTQMRQLLIGRHSEISSLEWARSWLARNNGLSPMGWLAKPIGLLKQVADWAGLKLVVLAICFHGYRTINLFLGMW